MMDVRRVFTENQIVLLEEAINIGAGNAVTALSQILNCDTDMSLPVLKVSLLPISAETFHNQKDNGIGVVMNIVGDLQGQLVFILPQKDAGNLSELVRQARQEQKGEGIPDSSIIVEISNIMAGVFLTAIHDFCGLNSFHTVPLITKNDSPDNTGGTQQYTVDPNGILLVATNEFMVNHLNIRAYLLIILTSAASKRIIQAMETLRES